MSQADVADPTRHVLVVTGTWADEGEMEIEHPADCPREMSGAGYWLYLCPVGQLESDSGLESHFAHADDPDPFYRAEKVTEGRYEIEPWFETHPGGPWGPTEYSAGLGLMTRSDTSANEPGKSRATLVEIPERAGKEPDADWTEKP